MIPSGMPIAIATASAAIPNWNEIGRLSWKMLVTVLLRFLSEGPKFPQRSATFSPKKGKGILTK